MKFIHRTTHSIHTRVVSNVDVARGWLNLAERDFATQGAGAGANRRSRVEVRVGLQHDASATEVQRHAATRRLA